MAFQTVFRRRELKYLITPHQKELLLAEMASYMTPDQYGKTTVRNLYFDTDSYLLIRRSMEKPVYKEKLRLRSYTQTDVNTPVFAELKKKYQSVVYKRRIALPYESALRWLTGEAPCPTRTQITHEIDYFLSYYGALHPTVFLSYEREAYYAGTFRVTFDESILVRQTDLSLSSEVYGTPILPPDTVLMELKCDGGIPLWMTGLLTKERIFTTSFSKYGTAYKNLIFPTLQKEERFHA